jgi:hypothetical protein
VGSTPGGFWGTPVIDFDEIHIKFLPGPDENPHILVARELTGFFFTHPEIWS